MFEVFRNPPKAVMALGGLFLHSKYTKRTVPFVYSKNRSK